MNNKRILIQEIDGSCIFREVHETCAGGFCEVDLMCAKQKGVKCDKACFIACTKKVLNGISRDDAVNRIAKTFCNVRNCYSLPICQKNKENDCWLDKLEFAEAALEALLK